MKRSLLTIDFAGLGRDRENARRIVDHGLSTAEVGQALTLARILDEARRLRRAARAEREERNHRAAGTMEARGDAIARECEKGLEQVGLDPGREADEAAALVRALVEASYRVPA